MNNTLKEAIGVGAGFPIFLTQNEYGLTSWQPLEGDINLINQNIASILNYQLGQRIRQEDFGGRLWEAIEEPNNQASEFLVRRFIKDALKEWEERITVTDVKITRTGSKMNIEILFRVNKTNVVSDISANVDTTSTEQVVSFLILRHHQEGERLPHDGQTAHTYSIESCSPWRIT